MYSVNGTNTAKNSTATFSKAGSYTLTATLTDAGGLTATSHINIVVDQTLTTISVSPMTVTVEPTLSQPFFATALDQFDDPLATQPMFTWTTDSGSVDASGIYTAAASTGSAVVRATVGMVSGTANVNIAWLKGDIDGNGSRNVSDMFALMVALTDLSAYQSNRNLAPSDLTAIADIDGDASVTNADVQALLNLLAGDAAPGSAGGSGATTTDAAPGSAAGPGTTGSATASPLTAAAIDSLSPGATSDLANPSEPGTSTQTAAPIALPAAFHAKGAAASNSGPVRAIEVSQWELSSDPRPSRSVQSHFAAVPPPNHGRPKSMDRFFADLGTPLDPPIRRSRFLHRIRASMDLAGSTAAETLDTNADALSEIFIDTAKV
jgi:hypothetical protein